MAKEREKAKEEPNQKKKRDPFEVILKGDRITVTKKTRRGNFEIVFPLPSDLRRIELLIADRLEGKPITSFSESTLANTRVYATLDVVVTNAPKWWMGLSSSEECPDDALITSLYRSYLRHYDRIQKLLAEGQFGRGVGQLDVADSPETVGGGAFQDITHG